MHVHTSTAHLDARLGRRRACLGPGVGTWPVPDEVNVERPDARALTLACVQIVSQVRTSSDPECSARKGRPK